MKMFAPVCVVQARDCDAAGRASVDELVVCDIDSPMCDAGAVCAFKEDEVADLRLVYHIRSVVIAVGRQARDARSGVVEGAVNVSAAVETAWRGAAPYTFR